MVSCLPSNGRISSYFETIHRKYSTHAYFEVRFHPILSKNEIPKIDFLTSSLINSTIHCV